LPQTYASLLQQQSSSSSSSSSEEEEEEEEKDLYSRGDLVQMFLVMLDLFEAPGSMAQVSSPSL
jgi:hypothetical protein